VNSASAGRLTEFQELQRIDCPPITQKIRKENGVFASFGVLAGDSVDVVSFRYQIMCHRTRRFGVWNLAD
jgi:hypothetical protein